MIVFLALVLVQHCIHTLLSTETRGKIQNFFYHMPVIDILSITVFEVQNPPPPNICFCCAVPEVPVSSGNVPTVVAGPIVKCLLLVYFFHSIYNLKRKGLVWNYSCQGNNENWLYTLLSPLSTILLGKQHDTLCVCVYGWMGVCICIQILHMNIYIYMGSDLSDGLT